MDFQLVLQAIRDIVVTTAAATGAFVALRGLKTWRHQLRASTELDVARPVLRAAYRIREAVDHVRDPLLSISETERALYTKRWEPMIEAISDFRAAAWEAEVLWGKSFLDSVSDLKNCIKELSINLAMYLPYADMADRTGEQEQYREHYRTTVQHQGDTDVFKPKLGRAIEKVESYLRPKIELAQI